MAFTLRISFSGLCLFVPEPVGGGGTGRMHVLMPGMSGHHHGPEHRHVPVVVYDAGSLVQGGGPLGVPALARLTGHTLTLGDGDTAGLSLCGQIVDLAEITGRPVDPDHLDADTSNKLVSRVTLRAGAITRVASAHCWEMRPGEVRPIAYKVEWEIPDYPGDGLTLSARPLGGGGSPRPLGMLHPHNGMLSIEIMHETVQDMPPEPLPADMHPQMQFDETPPHFSAFYALFGDGATVVIPRYRGTVDECPPVAGACPEIPPELGAYASTCMVAGAGGGGT
jgi:hypothetical protein